MELPTGTVTFLISDIEGSTRLAANLGPDWPAVLGEHAALIRQAVAAEGGIEVSTEGDSFFCVFVDPEAALRAAVGVVRSMATHGWPEEGRVSVRIGLHTGDGVLGGDNYVGLDVHRAARICSGRPRGSDPPRRGDFDVGREPPARRRPSPKVGQIPAERPERSGASQSGADRWVFDGVRSAADPRGHHPSPHTTLDPGRAGRGDRTGISASR